MDLIGHIGPTGNIDEGYSYNSNHQLTYYTNAVGYVTSYTYDAQNRLITTVSPSSLTTSNYYTSGGPYSNWVQSTTAIQIGRSNSFTYSNDTVLTYTDPLGLTTTYEYDALQRVTSSSDSRGTISYSYNKLDLAAVTDPLTNTTYFGYDGVRRGIAVTNALGYYSLYNYCSCGALDSIQDANGNLTTFSYDNAGRQISVIYPDGYEILQNFDSWGMGTNFIDSAGVSTTNLYNYETGLGYVAGNSAGQVYRKSYDINDRLTNSVNMNGVMMSSAFDLLGRILSCTYADGGTESFVYSPFGLTAYTNQLGNATLFGYDPAGRKTTETNALLNVVRYSYDSAGNLSTLIDQNGSTTSWGYDFCGRVTNKVDATATTILTYGYDADNRLTNRWSLAKGNTTYAYDALGNLASVVYAASHPITNTYNAMNWMTSMSDGVGITTFTYTPAGQLASEDGPWASDTVSYSYSDRLRWKLDLQQPNTADWTQIIGFDRVNRMSSISSPAGNFAYTYNPGLGGATTASRLVSQIALPSGAAITNAFDGNGRTIVTSLANRGGTNLDLYAYTYNNGNQRTQVTRGGENSVDYTYDAIGQVIGDQAYEAVGGTLRLNEQLGYNFDPAGNLAYRTNNALIQKFQVNNLNELTSNTGSGTLTVVGMTTSTATSVAVNGTNAARYGDATFAAANMPLTTGYTAIASDSYGRHSTNTISVNLSTNRIFQYRWEWQPDQRRFAQFRI